MFNVIFIVTIFIFVIFRVPFILIFIVFFFIILTFIFVVFTFVTFISLTFIIFISIFVFLFFIFFTLILLFIVIFFIVIFIFIVIFLPIIFIFVHDFLSQRHCLSGQEQDLHYSLLIIGLCFFQEVLDLGFLMNLDWNFMKVSFFFILVDCCSTASYSGSWRSLGVWTLILIPIFMDSIFFMLKNRTILTDYLHY